MGGRRTRGPAAVGLIASAAFLLLFPPRARAVPTVLGGELAVRAAAVHAALPSLATPTTAELDATMTAIRSVLYDHGVFAAPGERDADAVLQCPEAASPEHRRRCLVDALVWVQHTLVDGAGLGARSQPLPPHRKRLSRKEKAALAADTERRRERALRQVASTLRAPRQAIARQLDDWLRQAGPGRWRIYRQLVKGLARYRALARHEMPALPADTPIAGKYAYRRRKDHRGWLRKMSSAHRFALRLRLCAEGYCAPAAVGPPPPKNLRRGVAPLDKGLSARLRQWQRNRGLRASGLLDRDTLAELRVPMSGRVQQIRLALQRIRDTEINPDGEVLIANIPAFRLDIWRDGKLYRSHRTQVGIGVKKVRRTIRGRKRWLWVPGRRTPMISSKLDHMILDPEWVVPSSIRREYRFLLQRPGWMEENGFEMRTAANGGSYFVMRSGARNALGRVKFLFPNPHLVYLHDTPAQRWFAYPRRLKSHGCVRVEHASRLARELLAYDTGSPWSKKKWERYLEKYDNKWVRLRHPPALHLVYWTADSARDGRLRFYADPYRYDRPDLQRVREVARGRLKPGSGRRRTIPAGPARPVSPRPDASRSL